LQTAKCAWLLLAHLTWCPAPAAALRHPAAGSIELTTPAPCMHVWPQDHQIVFSDTPGVLLPQSRLQEGMMACVRSSLVDADVLILVVDIFQQSFPDDKVLRQLRASPAALLVLVNKVDLLDVEVAADERRAAKVAERIAQLGSANELLNRWHDEFPEATVLPVAARRGTDGGVEAVRRQVLALLPEHPPFYDKDQLTDRPERFFAAEMIREAIFEHYSQEIPYACECRVTSFKEDDDIIRIGANIFVSHESQVSQPSERDRRPTLLTLARPFVAVARSSERYRHRQGWWRTQEGRHERKKEA
jgi:GTP-binding protein Era